MYIDSKTWTKDNKDYYSTRQKIKSLAPADVHIPDAKEAKMLRKIKAETGLTETEIRSIPKYKWMLARSEQRNQTGLWSQWHRQKEKLMRNIMKTITKKLKLAKEHPLVVAEFKAEIQRRKAGYGWGRWILSRW